MVYDSSADGISTKLILWGVAFAVGLIFAVLGIISFLNRNGKGNRFTKALLFEFLACWVLNMPAEIHAALSSPRSFAGYLEGIFSAFLKTLTKAMGESYERVTTDLPELFVNVYSILMVVTNIIMLLFAAGLILVFFHGPLQSLILSFRRGRRVYFFPEVNERTLAIAESIPRTNGEKSPNIVFLAEQSELDGEAVNVVEKVGGFVLNKESMAVFRELQKHAGSMEVFLFCSEERYSLSLLDGMSSEVVRDIDIRFYVEIHRTSWILCDSLSAKLRERDRRENVVINYVRTEANFVYNDLYHTSIYEHAIPSKDLTGKNGSEQETVIKDIRVLLVGMNERNLEMLKAVLQLGQMPGYRLSVVMLDKKDRRDRFRLLIPELQEHADIEGDAIYSFKYISGMKYRSAVLEDTIRKEIPDFTFAFINVEKDRRNMDIAVRLNALACRMGRKQDYTIQVSIRDNTLCRVFREGGQDGWDSRSDDMIRAVGSVKETYDYGFITMSSLEEASIRIHDVRQAVKKKEKPDHRIVPWKEYCNQEYNRRAVYARTLSLKYKYRILTERKEAPEVLAGGDSGMLWLVYEHMRWNMYTRTNGYQGDPEGVIDGLLEGIEDAGEKRRAKSKLRTIAMMHPSLVRFDELDEDTRMQDALSPEEVAVLKELFGG